MAIHIYNSLTKKKEEFKPLNPGVVNMYSCGVTVYDACHIGHARSLYIFDVIRRYLKYRGFQVNFVRNITDIDDKIIRRAQELKCSWQELVEENIKGYYKDLEALSIDKADLEPRATENILPMIEYIGKLIEKGYGYVTSTGVYFDVRKFLSYGKLSGQSIEQILNGVRKEPDETKHDPLDFALWKRSKEGEPFWESPWGNGRPGWHIECSVMSARYLKALTLDIHAGGRDLIFPHHENEIAQAEALTGKPFANYWLHHGLLTINAQKMSKSLGNFLTIQDFISKYAQTSALKIFFLSAHYSHPIDYNEDKIRESLQALERITIFLNKAKNAYRIGRDIPNSKFPELESFKDKFREQMDDDFSTPGGLAVVFDLVNIGNKNIDNKDFIIRAGDIITQLLGVLGVSLNLSACKLAITGEEIKAFVTRREKAREVKDYRLADEIRKNLESLGVILEDEKGATTWRWKI